MLSDYEKQRNSFIPEAEAYAYAKTSDLDRYSDEYRDRWNELFHKRMDSLVQARLYRRWDYTLRCRTCGHVENPIVCQCGDKLHPVLQGGMYASNGRASKSSPVSSPRKPEPRTSTLDCSDPESD